MKEKSGERTLLASVALSSPGPIVLAIGLALGRSSTQLADFIRRLAELAAIIVSWLVYRGVRKTASPDPGYKARLERRANICVGAAMCLSGAVMALIAIFAPDTGKGNVIPGLAIAILGVITNTWFWRRYHRLNREKNDAILAVQSRLYRAKSFVDACVTAALAVLAAAPLSPVARYVDVAGSIVVSLYLVANGLMTLRGTDSRAEAAGLR